MNLSKLFVTLAFVSVASFSLTACSSAIPNTASTEVAVNEPEAPSVSQEGKDIVKIADDSLAKIKTSGYTETVTLDGVPEDTVVVIPSGVQQTMFVYDSMGGEYFTLDGTDSTAVFVVKQFANNSIDAEYSTEGDITTISLTDSDNNKMVYTVTVKDGLITKVTKTFQNVQEFEAVISYSITAEGQKVLDKLK